MTWASSGGPGLRFGVICLLPVATLAGYSLGGAWAWLGFAAYVAIYVTGDAVLPRDNRPPIERGGVATRALPFVPVPLVLACWLGFLAFFSYHARTLDLIGAAASLTVSVAIAGTVTAHELVHRTSSPVSLLAGRLLLAFIFDAAFAIEHVYGHHAKVATYDDAATARRGENIYAFFWRSTTRSFAGAWTIESARLARRQQPLWSWHNRNLRGLAMSLALVIVSVALAGWAAGLAFVAIGFVAKLFLEMTNYVEHYGLVRVPGTPVAPRHSWDTAGRFSAVGMFNLGRHAAHHVKGNLAYWALPLAPGAPHMLSGVAASAIIAVVPPLWFRMMRRRLAKWDRDCATPGELALLNLGAGIRST